MRRTISTCRGGQQLTAVLSGCHIGRVSQLDIWHVNALLERKKYSRPFELILARARKQGDIGAVQNELRLLVSHRQRRKAGPLTLELHGEAIDFPSSLLVLVNSITQWSSEPRSYGATAIYPTSLDICAISFATTTLNLPVSSQCSKKRLLSVLLRPCSSSRSACVKRKPGPNYRQYDGRVWHRMYDSVF